MKIPPWPFGSLGGPIVGQVTLGSFSAPPVPGDLKNDLRVTWDTLGPPPNAPKILLDPNPKRIANVVFVEKSIVALALRWTVLAP